MAKRDAALDDDPRLQELYTRVTDLLCQRHPEGSEADRARWKEASEVEEAIAEHFGSDSRDVEADIGRSGAVSAALKAGDLVRAKALWARYGPLVDSVSTRIDIEALLANDGELRL